MLRDIKSTVVYQILGIILGFANSIIVSRALGPEGRGEIGLIIASVGLLALVAGLGLPSAITYFVSSKRLSTSSSLKYAGITSLAAFLFTSIAIVVFRHFEFTELLLGTSNHNLLIVFPVATGLAVSLGSLSALLAGQKRFITRNRITLFNLALNVVAGVGVYVYFGRGEAPADKYYWLLLCASLATAIAMAISALKSITTSKDSPSPRSMVSYGIKSVAADLLQFLSYRLDLWIVAYFCGLSQLGIYVIAVSLSQYLWLLPNTISQVIFPNVADDEDYAIPRAILLSKSCLIVGTLIALIACLFLYFFIPLAYGEEFTAARVAFPLLCIGAVPFCYSKVFAAVLAGKGKISLNLAASAAGAIATVVLDLILIPKWGINGAAVATSCSYIITTFLVLRFTANSLGMPVKKLALPDRELFELWQNKLNLHPKR